MIYIILSLVTFIRCQQSFITPHKPIVQTEEDFSVSERYFRYGATNIPHPKKTEKGGEDAWVASSNLLVVADGVGGWERHGIDSGLYSKQLVTDIKKQFDKNEAKDLREILVNAVAANQNQGSTTCVLAKFDTSRVNYIKTTNLGDSGYILYRPNFEDGTLKLVYRSTDQLYRFNFPYQAGSNIEPPYKADDQEHEVQDDDILVMYSDGMSDNLYEEDIQACIVPYLNETKIPPQAISDCLAYKAGTLSFKENYKSPFSKTAQDSGALMFGEVWPDKGKIDDIVVIVAQIHMKNEHQVDQDISTNGTELKEYLQSSTKDEL